MKSVLFLFTVCFCSSCLFPEPCKKHYAFDFPVSVTPQDTFTIGDTIWWEVDIPNQLLDHNSGDYIDITNFELFFSFGIGKVDTTIPITGNQQTYMFDLVQDIGKIVQRTNGLSYTYLLTESTQDKRIRIGSIPKEEGTFDGTVSFPNLYYNRDEPLGEELEISDPECEETISYYSTITINNEDINYYMVEGVCLYALNGEPSCYEPESELHMYSIYAFHVKSP